MATVPSILRVCLHGSVKSLIAAEHCQKLASRHSLALRATAAGAEPDAEIPRPVVEGLLRDGIDVRGRHPADQSACVMRLVAAWEGPRAPMMHPRGA